MESLLKLSGLLGEEDVSTDLGALEKRLADQAAQNREQASQTQNGTANNDQTPTVSPTRPEVTVENGTNEMESSSSLDGKTAGRAPSTSNTTENREAVEALSDMMCSLVTTNCGETRYIGA